MPTSEMQVGKSVLPVAKPLLPVVAQVIPYFEAIDSARIYSNFGPLCRRLELRLAKLAGLGEAHCVTGANATIMLSAVLMTNVRAGADLCIMPSWTFCASAHAVKAAGLTPFFVDVDAISWQLTPTLAEAAMMEIDRIAAVMVVAPFGVPVDLRLWEDFYERTGIPVVVDAAAAMGNQEYGRIPVVVSLHPTKSLGAAEGAFLITSDTNLVENVRARLNFGFPGERTARFPGFNGKMSEYGAAVALAALDQWENTQTQWLARMKVYTEALGHFRDIAIFNRNTVTSTLIITTPMRDDLRIALKKQNIDTRLWWNIGCHAEPAFSDCPRTDLPVTEDLAARSLGLPFFRDMSDEDILQVAHAVADKI